MLRNVTSCAAPSTSPPPPPLLPEDDFSSPPPPPQAASRAVALTAARVSLQRGRRRAERRGMRVIGLSFELTREGMHDPRSGGRQCVRHAIMRALTEHMTR